MLHNVSIEGLTETILQRLMVEPNQQCVFSTGDIVRIREVTFHEDIIEFKKTFDIACSNPYYDARLDFIFNLLSPIFFVEMKDRQIFFKWEK